MTHQDAIVARFTAGEISREIALAQMLLGGAVPDVTTLPGPVAELALRYHDRLGDLAALARTGFEAHGDDPLGATAALFDRLAKTAPEAGVAFYSFGDPALLSAATAELVSVIQAWAPVDGREVLDFGCGIGRVATALAPHAARVTGVDLSPGMVAEARARAAGLANVDWVVGNGRLDFAPSTFDVIVAADCMPFVVSAGEASTEALLADFARVLRPGGDLLVFNWSYRGDPARDVADAHALARRHGFDLRRAGERPFAIWDGTGFHLRRLA